MEQLDEQDKLRPHETVRGWLRQHRCLVLLATLLAFLLLYPYVTDEEAGTGGLVRVFMSAIMIGGVASVCRKRWQFVLGLSLLAPTMVATWIEGRFDHDHFNLALKAVRLAFLVFLLVMDLGYVLAGKRVSSDRLAGAFCGYLLVGLIFANLCNWVHLMRPYSYTFSSAYAADEAIVYTDFLFYSFVTLTTLGYGDIVPRTTETQSMAILEAVIGVLYTAAFVAWIVSTLPLQQLDEKKDE